jgi:hypothetical protein
MTKPDAPIKLVRVPLASIEVTNRATQSRQRMYEHRIVEYAEAIQRGANLFNVSDAVTLFHDGATYWIGDGWHRISAALRVGHPTILAAVTDGRQGRRHRIRDRGQHAARYPADHRRQESRRPAGAPASEATAPQEPTLLYQLIRLQQYRLRNRQSEGLGGLEIDD